VKRLQDQLVTCLKRSLAGGRPVIPEAGRLLWGLFVELSAGRSGNGFGPNPLSWAEIEAWVRFNRWPLQRHHVVILRAMDAAWLDYARRNAKQGGKGDQPTRVRAEMTPAAFDGMFKR
jgi:hypothetical protein